MLKSTIYRLRRVLLLGFKLVAGALASLAFVGVAIGAGLIQASLVISIGRNPSKRDELLRYAFIGFSLVEVSGLIGLVMSFLLLFGFDLCSGVLNYTWLTVVQRRSNPGTPLLIPRNNIAYRKVKQLTRNNKSGLRNYYSRQEQG